MNATLTEVPEATVATAPVGAPGTVPAGSARSSKERLWSEVPLFAPAPCTVNVKVAALGSLLWMVTFACSKERQSERRDINCAQTVRTVFPWGPGHETAEYNVESVTAHKTK